MTFALNFQSKQFYFCAFGGIDWPYANDTKTIISPIDTAINHVSTVTSGAQWGAGISWHISSYLWLQTNFYKINATLGGAVWDFSNPNFDDYTFSAPFTSSRLMLDVKPIFFTHSRVSFYGIAGLGGAWNSLSYTEVPTDSGAVRLSEKSSRSFSYEFGAGISRHIIDNMNLQVEYLWSALGSASPGNNLVLAPILKPAQFTLRAQSVLFGLSLVL